MKADKEKKPYILMEFTRDELKEIFEGEKNFLSRFVLAIQRYREDLERQGKIKKAGGFLIREGVAPLIVEIRKLINDDSTPVAELVLPAFFIALFHAYKYKKLYKPAKNRTCYFLKVSPNTYLVKYYTVIHLPHYEKIGRLVDLAPYFEQLEKEGLA